ncbi:MAG TPA: tetratricopeptide repeat protein [Candidatus Polarisedimenticolia bacterium]|jgi:tetratricopeptide (TPR) repeat protein|nr:tetratricopeptide repeat protein [Candidatus Polarisedimenticolia bacterium]
MGIIKAIAAALLASLVLPALAQTRPLHKSHPQATPVDDRSADALKDAESLLQKQQYSQAEEKLQTIVTQQAQNPQAWFDLGFAQSHQGKTTDAIASYKKATQLDPKWFEAQHNLGLALAKSGDLKAAAAALKIAVTLKPTIGGQQALAAAWLSLAQVTEESAPQESLAAYQKAIELDPANPEAQLGVARMAERSGNAAAAEQQYLKLAEAGSNDSIERLIGLYLKQKRFADAETWLHKYISANPQSTAAQLQLGKLQAAEGKTQEAIATLEPLYKTSPDPKLARDLASLYLETKQYPAAADLLGPLVAQSPADAQLHLDYGTALMHQLKYAQAQAVLLKAVQLKPNLVEAYFDLGYAAEQNKNYELTIRVLDARAKLQPETPATYFLRATAYDNLRMYKPAAANYKLFLGVAGGKFPDQEFQARHRLKAILPD